MHRFELGLLLVCIVMLTGCAGNANSPEDTELSQLEDYAFETDSDNSAVESNGDNNAGSSSETAQADDKEEDTADAAQPNDTSETDTIYLKPCNTYQDILDNAYEVIIHRGDNIVEADEIFTSVGIWEAGMGRSTDESLAGIEYAFYDVDGNGVEELFIMDTNEDSSVWDNRILLMYSLLDGKPVLVIDGWARNRYYLLNDGTFYNEGSSGAAYTTFATYRMAKDGVSLEVIDYYFTDYRDDSFEEYWLAEGNWGWFHNTTGEWEKDKSEFMEFEDEDAPWEMMATYMEQVKELDLTSFESLSNDATVSADVSE